MPEPTKPSVTPMTVGPKAQAKAVSCDADRVICERCGQAEMFRMHAVWRCPNCGYKTDCCGW